MSEYIVRVVYRGTCSCRYLAVAEDVGLLRVDGVEYSFLYIDGDDERFRFGLVGADYWGYFSIFSDVGVGEWWLKAVYGCLEGVSDVDVELLGSDSFSWGDSWELSAKVVVKKLELRDG